MSRALENGSRLDGPARRAAGSPCPSCSACSYGTALVLQPLNFHPSQSTEAPGVMFAACSSLAGVAGGVSGLTSSLLHPPTPHPLGCCLVYKEVR